MFSLRLLVSHPSADLGCLASVLGLKPDRTWRKGDPITTPKGRQMPGSYGDSRWSHEWRFKGKKQPAASLSQVIDRLGRGRQAFLDIKSSGGEAQLILSLAGYRHIGDTVSCESLRKLADLGLSLGIDVCAEPQRG